MKVEIGDEELTKKPNVLEELAYRDTWQKGADSFIAYDLRATFFDERFTG